MQLESLTPPSHHLTTALWHPSSLGDQLQQAHFGCQNAILQCFPQQLLELGLCRIHPRIPEIYLSVPRTGSWIWYCLRNHLFSEKPLVSINFMVENNKSGKIPLSTFHPCTLLWTTNLPVYQLPFFLHLAPPALIAWMSVTLRGVSDLIFNSSKAAVSWPLSSASMPWDCQWSLHWFDWDVERCRCYTWQFNITGFKATPSSSVYQLVIQSALRAKAKARLSSMSSSYCALHPSHPAKVGCGKLLNYPI